LKYIFHPIQGVFQAKNGPTIGKQSLLMLMVLMMLFGADLPKVPKLSEIYSIGRWKEANSVHGLCKLGWLWADAAMSMRNHIDCWSRKN